MTGATPKGGNTLDGRHFTARQIYIIVKIQSSIRMFLAKKKVYLLKQSAGMTPGMMGHHQHNNHGGEDFENNNVAVRKKAF